MGQALYRKYRSKSLDEIVGQSHVTGMLKRALANDNMSHAYLLTGPRGVGKTSIARILAHEINELPYADESTHLDIIEIDAASNNSVEDIRDLRDKVQIAPTSAKKKIYIIDEVHMLSKSAFNALLKTLEEPPSHVVFILATTDVEKLPATIVSRVQRFNFRSISQADLRSHLRTIADAEKIDIEDAALALISIHGNGSFRDSISLLDQLRSVADGTITAEHIHRVLGLAGAATVEKLIDAYQASDIATVVATLDELESLGTPAIVICDQLIHAIHARISSDASLLTLLDSLLDVPRSAWPHIKLLTALTANSVPAIIPTTKTAEPIRKLTPARSEPKPSSNESSVLAQQSATQASSSARSEAVSKVSSVKRNVLEAVTKPSTKEPIKVTPITNPQPFAWDGFLENVRPIASGAHSLLVKCSHAYDGSILTIYAGKKFAKVQIDKALPSLSAALQTFGLPDVTIDVLAATKPPEDGQTATILDIMGGGEEVKL